jgi:hypothetical protein
MSEKQKSSLSRDDASVLAGVGGQSVTSENLIATRPHSLIQFPKPVLTAPMDVIIL